MRKKRSASGFTFVELLVVVVIIALLIALLLPVALRGRKAANMVKCGSQLHMLFVAAVNRKSEANTLGPNGWTLQLLPYVGNNKQVYICPEDDNPATGDLRRYVIATATHDPNNQWNGQMQIPFDPGLQYSDGFIHCYRHDAQPLDPTGNRYELWFEDILGTSGDGDDVQLLVEKMDTGLTKVSVIREGSAFYHNSVIDTLTKQVVIEDASHEVGKYFYTDRDGYSSYALNPYLNDAWGNASKIFAMDYATRLVVDPIKDVMDPTNLWANVRPDNAPIFARHTKKVNILYADGTVVVDYPLNRTPKTPAIYTNYWQP